MVALSTDSAYWRQRTFRLLTSATGDGALNTDKKLLKNHQILARIAQHVLQLLIQKTSLLLTVHILDITLLTFVTQELLVSFLQRATFTVIWTIKALLLTLFCYVVKHGGCILPLVAIDIALILAQGHTTPTLQTCYEAALLHTS